MTGRTPAPELLLEERFEHPEGLVWDARAGRVRWVDATRGLVLSLDPARPTLETFELGQPVGAVAPRRGGGLVCAVREGFGLLSDAGAYAALDTFLAAEPHLQMNDGAVDAAGRFWAGSMAVPPVDHPGAAALYRLDPELGRATAVPGVTISNGIGWSPDGARMYYVDSPTRRIDVFDFELERGALANRRPLARFEHDPDGLAVDVEGCVWVALFGGSQVVRVTPGGAIDRSVTFPGTNVTTCAFGGRDWRSLFVAVSTQGLGRRALAQQKAGHVFVLEPGVEGLPTHEFLG